MTDKKSRTVFELFGFFDIFKLVFFVCLVFLYVFVYFNSRVGNIMFF